MLAADPWAYRNRIRLAFDAAGNPGYRRRRSHSVISITECPIAAPLLVESALKFGRLTKQFSQGWKPAEVSLFCNAEETALLISVFTAGGTKNGFHDFALALKDEISALVGIELVAEGPKFIGKRVPLDRRDQTPGSSERASQTGPPRRGGVFRQRKEEELLLITLGAEGFKVSA